MKPVVLILLLATAVQAQTLAEIARKERERQARVQSVRILNRETAKALLPAAPEPPKPETPVEGQPPAGTEAKPETAAAAPATETATPEPAAPPPAPLPPPIDPVKKYNEDLAKLRTRLQQLQDKEVALQLEVNTLTNQFFAPKTNERDRRQTQDAVGKKQSELTAVRTELDQTRKQLQLMETSGPPKQ